MKKTYKIEVDCANCANLMEEAARKTSGVAAATVLSGNRAAWLLWNGCLSYGAIGLMMGIEYLVRRRVMRHAA